MPDDAPDNVQYTNYQGLGIEEGRGVLKELIDTERIIQNIDMTLKGFAVEMQKDGGLLWVHRAKPYIADNTRILIINALRMHLNHMNMYSSVNRIVIEKLLTSFHVALSDLLYFNEEAVATNDSRSENDRWARIEFIHTLIMDQLWVALHQAVDGGQRGMLTKMGSYTEVTKPEEGHHRKLPFIG